MRGFGSAPRPLAVAGSVQQRFPVCIRGIESPI